MLAKSIALTVLIVVLSVCSSAPVWLPRISRRLVQPAQHETTPWKVAPLPKESQEPGNPPTRKSRYTRLTPAEETAEERSFAECANRHGVLIRDVCYPPSTTLEDVKSADELCPNLQACKLSLVVEIGAHNLTTGILNDVYAECHH